MSTECDVIISDFEKVCRICMKFKETFLSITSFQIIQMISSCASVQIWANDELPNQICEACFLQLQNVTNFRQLCEKSDTVFRQIVEQNKIQTQNKLENFKIELNADSSEIVPNNFLNVKLEHGSDVSDVEWKENDLSNDPEDFVKNENEDIKNEDEGVKTEELKSKKVVYECGKCHQVFNKIYNLGQHMHRRHKATGTKCGKCSLIFYHPLHLSSHQKIHNRLDNKKATSSDNCLCNICEKIFSNVHKLKRHQLTHGERKHFCDKCDRSFKDKSALKKHEKTVHITVEYEACHVCGKSIKKTFYTKHLRIHGERIKFSCEICSKAFFKKWDLEAHVKHVHENIAQKRNHLCNICGMGFQCMTHLSNHFLGHTKEKPYACDKCDKKFGRKFSLKTHILRLHLKERKHVCTYCSQAFFNKDILTRHVRRHTGEKPYKCHVCEKAFIQKITLDLHMKVHTNAS